MKVLGHSDLTVPEMAITSSGRVPPAASNQTSGLREWLTHATYKQHLTHSVRFI